MRYEYIVLSCAGAHKERKDAEHVAVKSSAATGETRYVYKLITVTKPPPLEACSVERIDSFATIKVV